MNTCIFKIRFFKAFLVIVMIALACCTPAYGQRTNVPIYYFHGIGDFGIMWNAYTPYFNSKFSTASNLVAQYAPSYNSNEGISTIATKVYNSRPYASNGAIVVAHSMGGLVARDIYRQYGTNAFSGMISIGTPHMGAPAARALYDDNVKNYAKYNILFPSYDKGIALANAIKTQCSNSALVFTADLVISVTLSAIFRGPIFLPLARMYAISLADNSISCTAKDKAESERQFEASFNKTKNYQSGKDLVPNKEFMTTLNNATNTPPLIAIYGSEVTPTPILTQAVRNYIAKYDDVSVDPSRYPFEGCNESVATPLSVSTWTRVLEPRPHMEETQHILGFYEYDVNNQYQRDYIQNTIKQATKNSILSSLDEARSYITSRKCTPFFWNSSQKDRSNARLKEMEEWVGYRPDLTSLSGLQRAMNELIGATHIETRTWQEYTMIDEVCEGEGGNRARQAERHSTGYCYPVWGWVTRSSTSTVYEPNDGAVPAKYSVGSANAGVNDGGQIPAPKGLIKTIIVEGVNHSEMGNNLKVREEIKKAFEGKHERNIFWIQSK